MREVKREFATINARLSPPRDPMSDDVVDRMLAGYAFVDELLERGVQLFTLRHLPLLLELNTMVLCGRDAARRAEFTDHLVATEARFYEERTGGIRDLLEWYEMHAGNSAWFRAAGSFIRILSKPQLFVEGNHRSGTLVASWILAASGHPPFVLSVDNALAYFEPSGVIREIPKNGPIAVFRMAAARRRLAAFLRAQANPAYLAPAGAPQSGTGERAYDYT